jgi:hypothetical protein
VSFDACAAHAVRAARYGCGFFEAHAPQSMTRAVALICALAGALCAVAAADVAGRPHLSAAHAEVIRALAAMATGFVAGGAVSLLVRQRQADAITASPAPAGVKAPA